LEGDSELLELASSKFNGIEGIKIGGALTNGQIG